MHQSRPRTMLKYLLPALLASQSLSTFAFAATDPLLTAISFALSGKDGVEFRWINKGECIVEKSDTTDDYIWKWRYFINQIDPNRTTMAQISPTIREPMGEIIATVKGENLIYDTDVVQTPSGIAKGRSAPHWRATTMTIRYQISDKDRAIRAWHYIFQNGCKGARSSF